MVNNKYSDQYFQTSRGVKKILETGYTWLLNSWRKRSILRDKQSGRILEIGAGKGEFISRFNPQNWQRFVLEPHAQVNLKNIKVFKTKLESAKLPNGYFDIIVGWHVIEHLDNPSLGLKKIYQSLKPGGLIFLSTPNLNSIGYHLAGNDWFHYDPKHHVNLYDKKTLKKLLKTTGFKVTKTKNLWLEYPFDLYHSLNFFLKPLFILKPMFSLLGQPETIMIIGKK